MQGAERALVESIRSERLQLVSASAEARSLLGRALQALAQDLYVGSGALLAELIQNADDCTFDAAVVPTLTLTQTADALVLESNEAGFTADNVRALCDVGRSTKRGSAAIGRKGLGFKATFSVSDTPHVVSGGYSFKFDISSTAAADAGALFGALVPLWVEPAELPPEARRPPGGTLLYLPLRAGVPPPPLAVPSATMLFLQKIGCIELRCADGGGGGTVRLSRTVDDSGGVRRVRVVRETIDGDGGATRAVSEWRVLEAEVSVPPDASGARTTTTVRVAFVADGAPRAALPLFAFLPLPSVGLCFGVHADFALTASRQALHADSPRNAALRDAVAPLLLRAVVSDDGWLRKRLGSWMPRRSECRDPFFLPLFDALESGLRESRVLTPEPTVTLIGNPLRDAVAPKDAVLRLVAPRKRGGAADADESGDVLGDEEWLHPQFVTNDWLYEATGLRFVIMNAYGPPPLGVDGTAFDGNGVPAKWEVRGREGERAAEVEAMLRLGARRFDAPLLLRCLEHWASTKLAGIPDGNVFAGLLPNSIDASHEKWIAELHRFLGDHMTPSLLPQLRKLPLLPFHPELVVPNLLPPDPRLWFLTPAAPTAGAVFTALPPSLEASALASGAARLVVREAAPFAAVLGVKEATAASLAAAVIHQHAAGAFASLDACAHGLDVLQASLGAWVRSEVVLAARAGVDGATARRAALDFAKASVVVPCSDGGLRTAGEVSVASVCGVTCPGCGDRGDEAAAPPPRSSTWRGCYRVARSPSARHFSRRAADGA